MLTKESAKYKEFITSTKDTIKSEIQKVARECVAAHEQLEEIASMLPIFREDLEKWEAFIMGYFLAKQGRDRFCENISIFQSSQYEYGFIVEINSIVKDAIIDCVIQREPDKLPFVKVICYLPHGFEVRALGQGKYLVKHEEKTIGNHIDYIDNVFVPFG